MTDTPDIELVETLREYASLDTALHRASRPEIPRDHVRSHAKVMFAAADRIERLAAEGVKMREALEALVAAITPLKASGKALTHIDRRLYNAVRQARQALSPEGAPK